ncbi:hypothetical protein EYB53_010685 [Candidatus Chloroploca sp. M-50]|uniref:Uncharacterized protein n=1 Tax=Candidatus Chloroploca mongolica TaxID=2528176 RepID=A0ABS4D9P9_9CHLR|nr:hypothetical protein [Candidatus Chloroploca mongolica]MBP1466171.1 hypothetical protein [Candidatus Chloroploca mongolica]
MQLRSLGSMVGSLAAGPVGALLGGLAGGLVSAAADQVLPGASGILANALSASGSEALQTAGLRLREGSTPAERAHLNHDLQTALRAACLAALHDLGGVVSFPAAWMPAPTLRSGRTFWAGDSLSLPPAPRPHQGGGAFSCTAIRCLGITAPRSRQGSRRQGGELPPLLGGQALR